MNTRARDVETVTASRRGRSRSAAVRWGALGAFAATYVPANAGLAQVGTTGGDARVGGVRAIRAMKATRRWRRDAHATTRASLVSGHWTPGVPAGELAEGFPISADEVRAVCVQLALATAGTV